MLFNTIDFIIFFVIICTLIVIIKNRSFQHLWLLGASYFFFYYTSNYLVTLLIASTLLDYYVGKAIWNSKSIQRKKALLITSLAGNLGLLGFFKYANFSIEQFNSIGASLGWSNLEFLEIALPIGISFYTFQTISYTVDIYRGKLTPSDSLKEFALFVSFFPQLVAGPIVRASEFLPQLREKIENQNFHGNLRQIIIHNSNLKLGVTIMTFGFFKKMFFADNIAPLVDSVFAYPIGQSSFEIIFATIAFGVQIYGDFSGYTDIAIGAALILGFKLPVNFNKPYFATSPIDFWRRWHISLSTWLRDYLYIPLGGNKKSKNRTYLNLFIVMFLGGLWHGASWNFVLWGVLHGIYLAIHKLIGDKFPFLKNNWFFKTTTGKIISIFATQYLIFLTWIPFRINDPSYIIYSMQKYLLFDFQLDGILPFLGKHYFPVFLVITFFVLNFVTYKKPYLIKKLSNMKLRYWTVLITSILFLIVLSFDGGPEDFIYFRF